MLLLLSSLSSSSCVLYYISTKQQHKSMRIENHRKKRNRSWRIRWERALVSFFLCVVAKNTRNGKHTYGTRYESIQTESEYVRVFCTNCTRRQDGDNVRHMHLIDLHLVKRSVSLRSIHEHRHQWTSANATAAQHKQNKNERLSCMVSTNERTGKGEREWMSVHGRFKATWRLPLSDLILSQYNGFSLSHHILVFINDKRISNNKTQWNQTTKTKHATVKTLFVKWSKWTIKITIWCSFGRERDNEREQKIQQLRWKRTLVKRIVKLLKRQVASFRHLPFICAKQNSTQDAHAVRIPSPPYSIKAARFQLSSWIIHFAGLNRALNGCFEAINCPWAECFATNAANGTIFRHILSHKTNREQIAPFSIYSVDSIKMQVAAIYSTEKTEEKTPLKEFSQKRLDPFESLSST